MSVDLQSTEQSLTENLKEQLANYLAVCSERDALKAKNEKLEKEKKELMAALIECGVQLAEHERNFLDIQLARVVVPCTQEPSVLETKQEPINDICIDFKIANPAKGGGGDKYESVQGPSFQIYFPQKYSRLDGKVREKMSVKLSCDDTFTDMKNTKSEAKSKGGAPKKKEPTVVNYYVTSAVINKPQHVQVNSLEDKRE